MDRRPLIGVLNQGYLNIAYEKWTEIDRFRSWTNPITIKLNVANCNSGWKCLFCSMTVCLIINQNTCAVIHMLMNQRENLNVWEMRLWPHHLMPSSLMEHLISKTAHTHKKAAVKEDYWFKRLNFYDMQNRFVDAIIWRIISSTR